MEAATISCPACIRLGDLNPDRRFIMHFPEEKLIWSIGSGYGGNALLGKKCFALRIASWMAREQGWMAEHMLILGLEDPSGKVTYMAAAFPSACGKTNLAMMVSALEKNGYRVWTVGDDICLDAARRGWLSARHQPGGGFFWRRTRDKLKTNGNVMSAVHSNTIFTNTAMTVEPRAVVARHGASQRQHRPRPRISRLARAQRCRIAESGRATQFPLYGAGATRPGRISPHWEDPGGVPISAFIFGGRRARLAPLVYESFNWQHGVFVGATMASETTAAATGAVGVTRRDPMAMLAILRIPHGRLFRALAGRWAGRWRTLPGFFT